MKTSGRSGEVAEEIRHLVLQPNEPRSSTPQGVGLGECSKLGA